jgi:hypothetical protein
VARHITGNGEGNKKEMLLNVFIRAQKGAKITILIKKFYLWLYMFSDCISISFDEQIS